MKNPPFWPLDVVQGPEYGRRTRAETPRRNLSSEPFGSERLDVSSSTRLKAELLTAEACLKANGFYAGEYSRPRRMRE